MKSLIRRLVETCGPSGFETQVRQVVLSEAESYVDEVSVDILGNLILTKGSRNPNAKKIMLTAHMDEIGVMVTHIAENGFIRFIPIGGVNQQTCLGTRVSFLDGTTGVIGFEEPRDPHSPPPFEQMYIDTGASSRARCNIQVGDVAVFDRPFADLGDCLVAKAMDDRIGVAVLVETLHQLTDTPHQITFVFSVQEEVGQRGAITAAYNLQPDLGLAVDVTHSSDTPKIANRVVCLGNGTAIKVRDRGMLADPRLVEWMVTSASRARLPYQLEVVEDGTTDARAIQLSQAGVPTGGLSIPCRYIHTPSEMVSYNDVLNSVKLLLCLLNEPLPIN